MPGRKAPDITNYFSAAKQSQQLSEAEAEIQRLKAEIEQLRNVGSTELEDQLATLRSQLQSTCGVLSISIDQIQPNPEQPRQTFLDESIESMSRSLDKDGQLEPIILIQRENLVLFDGERRWRSAKNLGWQALQAVIIPEPAALHRKALLTSLHREDLNPLDKAEAIVRELSDNTTLSQGDIPRTLATAVRRLNTQKRMNTVAELITATTEEQKEGLAALGLSDSEQVILESLLDLQLNPASVDANIFPMLSLVEDLKDAIRSKGLKGIHALALQKLSAKNLKVSEKQATATRVQTTKQVLAEKLSVAQTRKLVAEVTQKQAQSEKVATTGNKQISAAVRPLQKLSTEKLKDAEVGELVELQETLRQKLAEIEEILQQK